MQDRLVRASFLDVTPDRPLGFAATVRGRALDVLEAGRRSLRLANVDAAIDDQLLFTRIETSAGPLGLAGRSAGRGLRAALDPLRDAGADGRLLRRLLWDVPISAQVAGQTALLDHNAARAELTLSRRGTDQCSGWRADGQMIRQVDGNAGVLVMPLGPARTAPSVATPWFGSLPALAPMATRRTRVLEVEPRDHAGRVIVTARFADSYADPDGVHRALHEWTARTRYDPEIDRFDALQVSAGRLPWVECPFAGASASRLDGLSPAELDLTLADGFGGISTCTHLTDTLRTLGDIADLIECFSPAGTGR